MNLNKIFLIGRLTRDPESRTLPSGQDVSNFGIATNRFWTNPETNEKQEQTEFHNIVAFGKLAEICNQYLQKGGLVMIEGRIQTRNWQDQKGETKYRTEVVAESMQMGPRSTTQEQNKKEKKEEEVPEIQVDDSGETKEEIKDEDIPF
ncbi:MAG: single-stranded DNA-binding protein [Candidatus Portnoybacteria bacterium]|nr:single-stranded DNA-binding protein [Candidatus Portnoybacteria bacterium]